MMNMKKGMACILAASAVALAAPAAAELRSARVSYADLDLASETGQQALERRVKRAIRSVCGIRAGEPLFMHRQHRGCVAEAKRSSNGQVALAIASAEQRKGRLAAR